MSLAASTVFVVDDDVSVRDSLELLIESVGWHSQTFASAREFLGRLPFQAGPSCLVVDAGLPDFSSLERDSIGMPVILISGYDSNEVTVRAMQMGAVAVFTKPLEADALLRAVEDAVAGRRAAVDP